MPETRKLQRLGNISLVVSLPKKWVERYKLRPGDIVYVDIDETGCLKIVPQSIKSEEEKYEDYIIEIDPKMDSKLLKRLITSCYILGYDRVIIKPLKEKLSDQLLESIRQAISEHTGLGILEQDTKNVTLQCFVDVKRFSMKKLMKRLMDDTLAIVEILNKAITEKKACYLNGYKDIKNECERFFCLGVRQMVMSQIDWSIAKAAEIESTIHLLGNRAIFNSIKVIIDTIEEIYKVIFELFDLVNESPVFYEEMKKAVKNLQEVMEDAFKAFQKKSLLIANETLNKIIDFENKEIEIIEKLLEEFQGNPKITSKIILLNNKTMQIIRELETICRITINRVIEDNPGRIRITKEATMK